MPADGNPLDEIKLQLEEKRLSEETIIRAFLLYRKYLAAAVAGKKMFCSETNPCFLYVAFIDAKVRADLFGQQEYMNKIRSLYRQFDRSKELAALLNLCTTVPVLRDLQKRDFSHAEITYLERSRQACLINNVFVSGASISREHFPLIWSGCFGAVRAVNLVEDSSGDEIDFTKQGFASSLCANQELRKSILMCTRWLEDDANQRVYAELFIGLPGLGPDRKKAFDFLGKGDCLSMSPYGLFNIVRYRGFVNSEGMDEYDFKMVSSTESSKQLITVGRHSIAAAALVVTGVIVLISSGAVLLYKKYCDSKKAKRSIRKRAAR